MKSLKSIGNLNNVDDFSVQDATINNLTVNNIIGGSLVTASSNLGSTDIIVGNSGLKDVKSSSVSIDSTNNMIVPGSLTSNAINTYGSSGSDVIFAYDSTGWTLVGTAVNYEYGFTFSTSTQLTISGLSFFKTSGMTSPSHTMHLWNSTGTLIGTSTFSNEILGAWNSASFSSSNPIIISGNYTISLVISSDTYLPNRAGTLPETKNGITLNNNVYNALCGYPTTLYGNSFEFALDIVKYSQFIITPGTSISSTGSIGFSGLTSSKIIWAICTPNGTNSTVTINSASSGISSIVYSATGIFIVNFTQLFLFPPSISINIITTSANATSYIPYVGVLTTSFVQVLTLEPGVAWYNVPFNIMIVGL